LAIVDQGSAKHDHVLAIVDQASADVDHGPTNLDQRSTNLDQGLAIVDQASAKHDHVLVIVDQGSANLDHGPANVDQGSANFDHGSASVDQLSTDPDQGQRNTDQHLMHSVLKTQTAGYRHLMIHQLVPSFTLKPKGPNQCIRVVLQFFDLQILLNTMERFKVKTGTNALSSSAVLERGRTIAQMLEGNAAYHSLQAMLPNFSILLDNLEAANNTVLFNGGKVAFEAKRLADQAVRGAISDFAGYVQGISSGDKALILSAGFDVVKERTPAPSPAAPSELMVRRTDQIGILKLRWKKVPAGKLYYVEMQMEGGLWERVATTTRATQVMENLLTGVRYTFRVQAITSAGISQMSEEVSNIAA